MSRIVENEADRFGLQTEDKRHLFRDSHQQIPGEVAVEERVAEAHELEDLVGRHLINGLSGEFRSLSDWRNLFRLFLGMPRGGKGDDESQNEG